MNLDYRTSVTHDSWDVHVPKRRPGHSVRFGWWISETVDEVLPSPKEFIAGPSGRRRDPLYRPLSMDKEIRLLCLYPGNDADPLSGYLMHTHLRKESWPEYDALSYVWNQIRSGDATMDINGHEFDITASVASALARLRHATTPRYVWIDFICINQEDLEERAEQVFIMSEIFGRAQRTCVHLGMPTPETASGFRALETLRSCPITGWSEIWEQPPPLVCAGILDIMERPWWRRTWCLQEAVMAKEVVVFCGEHSLTWSNCGKEVYRFSRSLKAAVLSPQWGQYEIGMTRLDPLLEILRMQLGSGFARDAWIDADQTPDLFDIAYDVRHRECSDPRDRLFGLFGIARSTEHDAVDLRTYVDYTKTNAGAFTELANLMLSRDPFSSRPQYPQEPHRANGFAAGSESSCEHEVVSKYDSPRSRPNVQVDSSGQPELRLHDQGISEPASLVIASDQRSMSDFNVEIAKGMAAINLNQKQDAAEIFIRLGRELQRSDEIDRQATRD